MSTIAQLEKAVDELIRLYKKTSKELGLAKKRLERCQAKEEKGWVDEREEILERVNSMIETIEDLGIRIEGEREEEPESDS